MDFMLKGLCPESKIAFVYTNVSESARELERRHLSGPTAGRVLGELLTGAALLSSNLSHEKERMTLQLKTDGPIGGGMAEAFHNGSLRGFTNTKILNDLDGDDSSPLSSALGNQGQLSGVQATPKGVTFSGQIQCNPPEIKANIAKYCYQSLQRPMGVEIISSSKDGYLSNACGITAERMPDGNIEDFVRVLERFEDGSVISLLERKADFGNFADTFALKDLKVVEMRPLKFGCTCSRNKTADLLSSLSESELMEIDEEGEGTAITCHFCGHHYTIQPEEVKAILKGKLQESVGS